MKNKFLILLLYYNRPNLVRIALNSIKTHGYDNWELAVLDDGSDAPAEPIVREILYDKLNQVKFYNTYDTVENKIKRGGANGSVVGKIAQESVEASDADYVFMLCDDDALYPQYMENLNTYFQNNPDEKYVYSHIHIYDPVLTTIESNPPFIPHHLNKTEAINPHFNVDASQVAWNRKEFVNCKIRFPYPMTANFDSVIYNQMYNAFGPCKFSGFIGQYKAMFTGHNGYSDQLSHRMGKYISNQIPPEDVYNIKVK